MSPQAGSPAHTDGLFTAHSSAGGLLLAGWLMLQPRENPVVCGLAGASVSSLPLDSISLFQERPFGPYRNLFSNPSVFPSWLLPGTSI